MNSLAGEFPQLPGKGEQLGDLKKIRNFVMQCIGYVADL
jgi:hypothetical protein